MFPNITARSLRPLCFLLVFLVSVSWLKAQSAGALLPFQGYLTEASGAPVADGARVVQFKMYDAPIGGRAVWSGEVHELSVNGGLVNTVLGSKTSLSQVDFGSTVYLEITVDSDQDHQITSADPPLLPRQIILPAVFALQALNSNLLNGFDWEVLFGSAGPNGGRISGELISDGSLRWDHFDDSSRNEINRISSLVDQLKNSLELLDGLDSRLLRIPSIQRKSVSHCPRSERGGSMAALTLAVRRSRFNSSLQAKAIGYLTQFAILIMCHPG